MTTHAQVRPMRFARQVEWKTLGLITVCYAAWFAVVFVGYPWSPVLAVAALAVLCALHSSLTHEALHGHPFADARVNAWLMALPLGIFVPYGRFRDLHLAHHRDCHLTDPYDDPESNFFDPAVWAQLPGWARLLWEVNNRLAGRMALGPLLGQVTFLRDEVRLVREGCGTVRRDWVFHVAGLVGVLGLVWLSPMPVWAMLLSAYLGMSLLKIRTFAEHRAHEKARGRSVIIEDRGPLALLFLNNNLHAVHHSHPGVPWYRLPALYRANRARYLTQNGGYAYRSYAEVFRAHFWQAKDPVPHPLRPPG